MRAYMKLMYNPINADPTASGLILDSILPHKPLKC